MEPRIRNRSCALIVKDSKILMVSHERRGKQFWVLPGGGVEYGETLEEACVRELKEEANFDIQIDRLLFVCDSVPNDKHRHVINYFFAATHVGGELIVADEPGLLDAQWIDADGIPHLTIYPHVVDEILEFMQTGDIHTNYIGNRWHL